MFADDTNLFFTHQDVRYLFRNVNEELENINQWFISNNISLDIKKAKYLFFHKLSPVEDTPLLLPNLIINNYEIKQTESIKFWGRFIECKLKLERLH